MNEQIPTKQISVRKASGEHEPYAPEKLADSLRQAGADEELVLQILGDINAWLAEGVSTRKIYARALSLLRRQRQSAHARYRVKDALMELGSSGYPFEVYIGEIFKAQGYEVQTGIVVEGASINHEMDVIATGKGQQLLLECKYTQKQGNHVSIQVPLYVHSRVADIVAKRKQDPALQGLEFIAGVVTNTRFSDDSTRYAKAYGMRLLSWDYPAGNGLKDLIVRDRLYPVTILTTISPGTKELLIREGLVSCGLLAENLDILLQLGLGEKKRRALNCELSAILGHSERC
jgi:hypothetical protein